jgi:hypothetical protein
MMSRGALLRIGVVLFAFGCGLFTDANVGRIIKDGTVVKGAEAGSGLPGISSHRGGGWNGAAASIHDMGTMNAEARARGYTGTGAGLALAQRKPRGNYTLVSKTTYKNGKAIKSYSAVPSKATSRPKKR